MEGLDFYAIFILQREIHFSELLKLSFTNSVYVLWQERNRKIRFDYKYLGCFGGWKIRFDLIIFDGIIDILFGYQDLLVNVFGRCMFRSIITY